MRRIVIPGMQLVSAANVHAHWRVRHKHVATERAVVRAMLGPRMPQSPTWHVVIAIRRPRAMDTDNMAMACKAMRDEIADWLGLDDRTDRIAWTIRDDGPIGVRAHQVEVTITGSDDRATRPMLVVMGRAAAKV